MTTYVTDATVTLSLGAGWAGAGNKDRALLEANTLLTAWLEPRWSWAPEDVPANVLAAGAELARESAVGGTLFPATERETTSSEVSAQTGTYTKKSFVEGSTAESAAVRFARALLGSLLNAYIGPVFLERV